MIEKTYKIKISPKSLKIDGTKSRKDSKVMVGQSKRLYYKSKADVQCNITGGQTIQIRA